MTYTFEVASDSGFTAIVAKKEKVAAGSDQTSVKLDAALAGGKGYYWRARANDGAVDGPNSSTINFSLGRGRRSRAHRSPRLREPNATVAGLRPNFVIKNASRTGPVGTIYYRFEVADNTGFSPLTAQGTVQEQSGGQTTWAPDVDLPTGKTLYWHVRTVGPAEQRHQLVQQYARVHRVEDGRRDRRRRRSPGCRRPAPTSATGRSRRR